MKKNGIYLLILTALLFSGCNSSNNETIISGRIIGDVPERIIHTLPIQGTSFWGFNDTIVPDSNGDFRITINIDKPTLIALFGFGMDFGFNTFNYVLVEPGKEYNVLIDLSPDKKSFIVDNNQCKAQALLASFPNHGHPQFDDLWHLHDSSVAVITTNVMDRKYAEITEIEELLSKELISQDAAELLIQTRRMYNYNVMGFIASMKYLTPLFEGQEYSDTEVLQLWNKATSSISADERFFLSSPSAYEYLNHTIWCRVYTNLGYKQAAETQREYGEKGLRHTRNLKNAKEHLDPSILEFHNAAYIYFHAFQKRYEKELIDIYEQFKESFPGSEFSEHLRTPIYEIAMFHKIADKGFSDKMLLIENYSEIESFSELISRFNGQKVYIGLWSTTCGWCKKEFEHNEELKEFLSAEKIQKLYISLDRDREDEQWQNMIIFYNLEGYHIRASHNLHRELNSLLSVNGIPHYALVDENGSVLIQKAFRPSELAKLSDQIKEIK